jgi:hypothetical protein
LGGYQDEAEAKDEGDNGSDGEQITERHGHVSFQG